MVGYCKWRALLHCSPDLLFGQFPHTFFEPLDSEGNHSVVHDFLDDADALAVLPYALWLWVDPGVLGKGMDQAL